MFILGNCIITRLQHRLSRFIYNMFHENTMIIANIKKLSSISIVGEKYRYWCYKYGIAHMVWFKHVNFVVVKLLIILIVNFLFGIL